tara:strand:+ start:17968 stop:19098 length:1131 start_codon:yes stop_codon:yes gene_type:complete
MLNVTRRYNKVFKTYNQGVALLTALLFVVLSVSVSTVLFMLMQVELGFADLMISGDRVQNSLKFVETEAIALLNKRNISTKKIINQSDININYITDYKFKKQVINYVNVYGNLEIQNGKFNINYLYDPVFCNNQDESSEKVTSSDSKKTITKQIFTNILLNLSTDGGEKSSIESITPDVAAKIIVDIQNWMCPVNAPIAKDNKDPYIKNIEDNNKNNQWPYQRGSQMLVGISELKLIKSIDNNLYNALIEHVSVWPLSSGNVDVKFDVRFLSPSIFAAILNEDINTAKSKLQEISKIKTSDNKKNAIIKLIEQSSAYKDQDKKEELKIISSLLGTDQNLYYLLSSNAAQGKFNITAYTLLNFNSNANVVWRSYGIL